MTSGTATRRIKARQETLDRIRHGQRSAARRSAHVRWAAWGAALLIITALVSAALITARPAQDDRVRVAPTFTLPASDGSTVSLADHRGAPVILYFNEGAGCDSCLWQMTAIEREPGFAEAGITVLPIVMNTAEEINADRVRLGASSPFLLDDGTVSAAYGTLGTGMHDGLPGHGFVLIDADGVQRWYGDYPSMWLEPKVLLEIVRQRL